MTRTLWTCPGSANVYKGVVSEVCPIKKSGDQERYRVTGEHMDCYAFHTDLAPDSPRRHEWQPSTLGHGETQCIHCLCTNREAAVISPEFCIR